MKFVAIYPQTRTVETIEAGDLRAALRLARLDPDKVDHGMLSGRGIAYVVYEFGLFVPPADQSYFRIDGWLIAGTCVLYGVDPMGETVDVMKSTAPDVHFYLGSNDVEAAIDRGEIMRPQIAVNGEVLWKWPDDPPSEFAEAAVRNARG